MLWSVERPFVGASAFHIPGATLRHCTGPVPAVLPASTEHGKRKWGLPRNLGDPVVSSAISRPELPGHQLQASAAHSSAGERTERVDAGGTAKRRQRSAAGRAAGSHSALIVPTKLANGPRPEPGEGSEASDHGTLLRNTANASKFDQRVHETTTDSRAGQAITADGIHFTGLPDGHRLVSRGVRAYA